MIAWKATHKAMKNSPFSWQIYVVKQVSRREATGNQMLLRKQRNESHCPRCKQDNETHDHIVFCKHEDAVSTWHDSI